jgi:hypothetical protein
VGGWVAGAVCVCVNKCNKSFHYQPPRHGVVVSTTDYELRGLSFNNSRGIVRFSHSDQPLSKWVRL